MRVVIFGTGKLAEVLHAEFSASASLEPVAFTVDAAFQQADTCLGLPVVPFEALPERYPPSDHGIAVGVGYGKVNRIRQEKHRAARAAGYALPSFVHASTPLSPGVQIGEGCVVLECNQLQPFCILGEGVFLWSGNIVGHHARIGHHSFLTSHTVVGGNSVLGERCFLGLNATVRDGVTVGDGCVLGPGALLMADAAPDGVYSATPTPRSRVPAHRLRGL